MDYKKIDDDLFLRALEKKDAPNLFELIENNRMYLREWLPWLDTNNELSQSENYIETAVNQWGIFYQQQLVGMIGLHKIDQVNKNTNIGYWLAQNANGMGIMTRATQAIVDYCFNELHLHRIGIRCAEFNFKSRAIPERLGFSQEGILIDNEWLYDHFVSHVVYAKIYSTGPQDNIHSVA